MNEDNEIRGAWILRGLDKSSSFLFSVQVEIEEDDAGLYGASVIGMENHMAAMGHTADEAFENAIALFQDTVDDCLNKKVSISYAIGSLQPITINQPIQKASSVFAMLDSLAEQLEGDWHRLTITSETMNSGDHAGY